MSMRAQTAPGVFQHRYGAARDIAYGSGPSLGRLTRSDWKQHARCAGQDRDAWFAEPGTGTSAHAAQLCHQCPVRRLCLAWALVFDEEFGVWGGLDPVRRRPLTRRLTVGDPLDAVLGSALGQRGSEVA